MKHMNEYTEEEDFDRNDDDSYASMYSRFRVGRNRTPKYFDAQKKNGRIRHQSLVLPFHPPWLHNYWPRR